MLPPWGNMLIEILKATALVSLITITDLTFRPSSSTARRSRTPRSSCWSLLIYLVHVAVHQRRRARRSRRAAARGLAGAMMRMFDWSFACEILPLLVKAAVVTIEATMVGFALAATSGWCSALARLAGPAGSSCRSRRSSSSSAARRCCAGLLPLLLAARVRHQRCRPSPPACWRSACTTATYLPRSTGPGSRPCRRANGRRRWR